MAAIPTLRLSELPGWALGGARTVVCQEIKSENSGWKSTVGCKWLLANKPFALLQLIHSYLPVRLTHLTGHHELAAGTPNAVSCQPCFLCICKLSELARSSFHQSVIPPLLLPSPHGRKTAWLPLESREEDAQGALLLLS